MTSEERGARALTWKIYLGFIFAALLIQPAIMQFNLISNWYLPFATWIPIILWAELANFMRSRLTAGELYLLLSFQPVSFAYALFFVSFIKNMYYANSFAAVSLGIVQHIPNWWVPTGDAARKIMNERIIFFNEAWAVPLALNILMLLLSLVNEVVIGYLSYKVFAVSEKLEFPAARASVQTVNTLTERPTDRMRALFISALAGVIVSLTLKIVPFTIGPFMIGGLSSFLPEYLQAGSFDFTSYLDAILPGASFIIPMDPVWYLYGFLIPVRVAFFQFAGAFVLYFIGTHAITSYNLWPAESLWVTGWGYWTLQYRSLLYFYVSLIIGLSVAAMIVPLVVNPKPLINGIKALKGSGEEGRHTLSPRMLLLLYVGSSSSMVFIIWALTGFAFPLWILFFFIVLGSFFAVYISTASLGVTLQGINVPYLKELAIFYSGYQRKDIWFAPLPLSISSSIAYVGPATMAIAVPIGGSAIAQGFFGADLLGVRHREYMKGFLILIVLSLVSSFFYTTLFWYISPMPSSAYPATIIRWPVDALSWVRMQFWVWTGYLFNPNWLALGFGAGAITYLATNFLLKMPYALVVLISGALLGMPGAFAQLIASILGDKFLRPKFGPANWYNYRPLIVMGYLLGDGIMETIRALMILATRSAWLLPF